MLVSKEFFSSRWSYLKVFLSSVVVIVFTAGAASVGPGVTVISGDIPGPLSPAYFAQPSGGGGGKAPEGGTRLDPEEIRYSQSTFTTTGKTKEGGRYAVEGNVQWLRDHPGQVLPWGGSIRVFRKEAFMDEWGPMTTRGYTGDPRNLENGKIYTLDHRRLVAYRRAGRKSIPVEWADLRTVKDNRWKFTTPNRGISIAPKLYSR